MPNLRVGQIVGTHGLKGHVKVDLLTDFPERVNKGRRLLLNGNWVQVLECKWHKSRPILELEGIDHISKAQPLQWAYLEAPADEQPELEEDEYLTEDLLDLEVFTTAGEKLGIVDDVLAYPAHDTLQVGEILIPVVKQFVKKIDIDAGRIEVELIPGMRPGDSSDA